MLTLEEMRKLTDEYYSIREERYAADKVAATLKQRENAAKAALLEAFQEHEISSLGGSVCRLDLTEKPEPVVQDWAPLWEHIQRTGEFDLLQRRLGAAAVKERWDAGVQVPGVTSLPVFSFSVHKV
jgi:hypothetical protein